MKRRSAAWLLLFPLLLSLVAAALSRPAAASLQADPTPTPPPTPTPAPVAGESAALVVILSTAGNDPPRASSTVMVFDGDQALVVGEPENGAFRAVLPEGVYDVALLLDSVPQAALLARDVDVSGADVVTLTLEVPAEHQLLVSVRTPNGNPPKNEYSIDVSSDDGLPLVSRTERPLSSGDSSFTLRAAAGYDLLLTYGDVELQQNDVTLDEDRELAITLPDDEGQVDIFLLDGGDALPEAAQLVVIDETGFEWLPNTAVTGSETVYLPAGAAYRVIAQYAGIVAEQSVAVEAGGLHPVTLDFAAQPALPAYEDEEATPEASPSG